MSAFSIDPVETDIPCPKCGFFNPVSKKKYGNMTGETYVTWIARVAPLQHEAGVRVIT